MTTHQGVMPDLSSLFLSERSILRALVRLADAEGRVTISTAGLAAEAHVARRTVVNGVRRLSDEFHAVRVERRTETGPGAAGALPNTYTVHPSVLDSKEV